jgi:hypothetical protein
MNGTTVISNSSYGTTLIKSSDMTLMLCVWLVEGRAGRE